MKKLGADVLLWTFMGISGVLAMAVFQYGNGDPVNVRPLVAGFLLGAGALLLWGAMCGKYKENCDADSSGCDAGSRTGSDGWLNWDDDAE